MKKYLPIYAYGAVIMLAGILLLVSGANSFTSNRLILGCLVIFAAAIAFIAAFAPQRKQVQVAYHTLHAIVLLLAGFAILLLHLTPETLTPIIAFLLFFYGFSEIIFCSLLFNLGLKVVLKVLIVRIILGLVICVGTVSAMYYTKLSLEIYGVLFLLIGINIMLYVPIIKEKEIKLAKR